MKKKFYCLSVLGLLLAVLHYYLVSCAPAAQQNTSAEIKDKVQGKFDSLQSWLTQWLVLVEKTEDEKKLRAEFLKGRHYYKRIEWALEYFFPTTAENINGAPLPEIEAEEHTVIEPSGFQVMEEYLFPGFDKANRDELIRESKKLQSLVIRAVDLWAGVQFRDDQVFDALRLELARIITLGISGFDTPLSLAGIQEIDPALQSIGEVLGIYEKKYNDPDFKRIRTQITDAATYTAKASSFDDFDRMTFITQYINPLSKSIFSLQGKLNIPVLTGISALRGDVATIFDENAFDINHFTPDVNSWVSDEKAALGKKLFYDPVLSINKKISCASCHKPELAFTDGLPKSVATGSRGFLSRNTPTLINAGYQHGQFYDLRATYLEDQVRDVIQNKDEIHGSLETAAQRITADKTYFDAFQKAFRVKDSVEPVHIQVALASYVRSLSGFQSAFDKYMRGDKTQMNPDAIEGFNLFMGKAKCGTCHFMPLFNGTVPPAFTATETEVLGVPADKQGKHPDGDAGRFAIYKIPEFQSSFKTPTVRNAALTGPYMHNGVFTTLEEVMDFYNKGGGKGLGLEVAYQTLPEDSLNLSREEQQKIIAFMKTLTDTSSVGR